MSDSIEAAIVGFVARTPEWVRRDMASKDASVRTNAEAALAAMIVNAINRKDEP
jgi:hypothetical protein